MSSLPDVLRNFAVRGGEISAIARRVVIEQRGQMRLKPGPNWLPFTAEQWMAIDEVAFCWHARVKMAPLVTAVVEDAHEDGHGRLDAKLWGAVPLVHGDGPEVDRGEVQRYLAELPWNPAAILRNPHLHFAEREGGAVRVWTREPSLYVDLFFNDDGDVSRIYCESRPYKDGGRMPWEGRFTGYTTHGELRVPTHGEVAWILPDGPFSYWRGEVTDLHVETSDPTPSQGTRDAHR